MAAILLLPLLHIPLPIHAAELEVYGRLPSLEHVALSPDGLRLAFIRTDADTRLLAVVSLSDRKVTHGFRLGENKVRSIKWADDNNLMIFGSATSLPPGLRGRTQEWVMLDVFDLSQHKLRPVPRLDVGSNDRYMNVVRGEAMVRTVNGHTVLFVPGIYVEGMTLPALFRIDLQTGQQSIVRRGSLETQGWLVDEAGEVVAEEDYFDQDRRWVIKIRRDGRLKEVAYGHETIEHPQVLGFGPQADTLLIESIENGDSVWRLMSH